MIATLFMSRNTDCKTKQVDDLQFYSTMFSFISPTRFQITRFEFLWSCKSPNKRLAKDKLISEAFSFINSPVNLKVIPRWCHPSYNVLLRVSSIPWLCQRKKRKIASTAMSSVSPINKSTAWRWWVTFRLLVDGNQSSHKHHFQHCHAGGINDWGCVVIFYNLFAFLYS